MSNLYKLEFLGYHDGANVSGHNPNPGQTAANLALAKNQGMFVAKLSASDDGGSTWYTANARQTGQPGDFTIGGGGPLDDIHGTLISGGYEINEIISNPFNPAVPEQAWNHKYQVVDYTLCGSVAASYPGSDQTGYVIQLLQVTDYYQGQVLPHDGVSADAVLHQDTDALTGFAESNGSDLAETGEWPAILLSFSGAMSQILVDAGLSSGGSGWPAPSDDPRDFEAVSFTYRDEDPAGTGEDPDGDGTRDKFVVEIAATMELGDLISRIGGDTYDLANPEPGFLWISLWDVDADNDLQYSQDGFTTFQPVPAEKIDLSTLYDASQDGGVTRYPTGTIFATFPVLETQLTAVGLISPDAHIAVMASFGDIEGPTGGKGYTGSFMVDDPSDPSMDWQPMQGADDADGSLLFNTAPQVEFLKWVTLPTDDDSNIGEALFEFSISRTNLDSSQVLIQSSIGQIRLSVDHDGTEDVYHGIQTGDSGIPDSLIAKLIAEENSSDPKPRLSWVLSISGMDMLPLDGYGNPKPRALMLEDDMGNTNYMGSFLAEDSSLAYDDMDVLKGRMKIDTTQIKHRLHTADFSAGGYKPSMPATPANVGLGADYKPFPVVNTVTQLRAAAEVDAIGTTIPVVIPLDMIESQLARLLDADMQLEYDAASTVWQASSDADADLSGRVALKALNDLDVANDLSVGGEVDIVGGLATGGALIVAQNADIDGSLEVAGNSDLHGNVTMSANLDVAGTSDFQGAVTMKEDLRVDGLLTANSGVQAGGTLHVVSTSDFDGNVDMSSAAVAGLLDIDGSFDADVSSFDVDATGKIEIVSNDSDSESSSAIIINATAGSIHVEAQGGISLDGTVDVNDNLDISGDLTVDGSSTLGGDVGMSANLTVDGTSTFNSSVTINADAQVDGALDANASVDVLGSLDVTGALTVDKNVAISGLTTIAGDLDVDGAAGFSSTTFTVDSSGDVLIKSSAPDDGSDRAIEIEATAGSVLISGAGGVDIEGPVEFADDVTIKDSLVLENTQGGTGGDEPDFIIRHNDGAGTTTDLLKFDGSAGGMDVQISGDITCAGNFSAVNGELVVQGSLLSIDTNVATVGDNILSINHGDADPAKKSVGIKLDDSTGKDWFFGLSRYSDRFVITKQSEGGNWANEDDMSNLDSSNTDPGELHVGSLRAQGIAIIDSSLVVGSTLNVDDSSNLVTLSGAMTVSKDAEVSGLLDVDGNVDISGGLDVHGKTQLDNSLGTYQLVIDASAAGLSSSGDRHLLDAGDAHLELAGDMRIDGLMAGSMEIAGDFQAFGTVGLGDADKTVTVYGTLEAERSATFKDSLSVHDIDGTNYSLVADIDAQQNGLSIDGSRAMVGDAFLTLLSGKDMLIQGDCGAQGNIFAGESIWFVDALKSRDKFKMQDAFTDGQTYATMTDGDQSIHGYVLASDAADVQLLLDNSPEALATVDGQKHVSLVKVLAGLVSGGSSLRFEHALIDFVAKNEEVDIGSAVHDGNQFNDGSYKSNLRFYVNGARLSDDDYELVADVMSGDTVAVNNKSKIKFNFALEEDDVLIIDIADANPAA